MMKKFARAAILALAATLAIASFACGKKDEKKLTLATSADFPPYEFLRNDEIVGIDIEIAAAIADKLGLELVIDNIDFDYVLTSVESKKCDIGMAGLTVTDERMEQVSFSTSYSKGVQVVIVPEGSPITSVSDLYKAGANHSIAVQQQTTGDLYSTWELEENDLALIDRYIKGTDAILALTTGKVDCVIIDDEPAKAFVRQNPGLKILDTEFAVEDYAIAVNKSNSDLLKKIDDALRELIDDGTVQSIVDKYITAN